MYFDKESNLVTYFLKCTI